MGMGWLGFPLKGEFIHRAAHGRHTSACMARPISSVLLALPQNHPTFRNASAMPTWAARQAGRMAARTPTARATVRPKGRVVLVRGKTRKYWPIAGRKTWTGGKVGARPAKPPTRARSGE